MALLTSAEDDLDNSYQEDEDYDCLPSRGSTEQEEEEDNVEQEEEYVCLPSCGSTEQEEEEEMDEEQQVLCAGRWSSLILGNICDVHLSSFSWF